MFKVTRAPLRGKQEKLVPLASLKPGEGKVFRFQGNSLEEALTSEDGVLLFQVINMGAKKEGRVAICSIDGKIALERDSAHVFVIVHDVELVVNEAETE